MRLRRVVWRDEKPLVAIKGGALNKVEESRGDAGVTHLQTKVRVRRRRVLEC